MSEQALKHAAKEFDKLRSDQITFLAGGGAKTFDEYRHVCGVIRGLTHAGANRGTQGRCVVVL
jgi:hypothetical protein